MNAGGKSVKLNQKSNYSTPSEKKALILAPFQFKLPQHLASLSMYLSSAGYDVTTLVDDQVTINHFSGDYLKQYGVIYISTHGGHSFLSLRKGLLSLYFFLIFRIHQ